MSYLMAGQTSELERLRLQSRVWEPAGRALLQQINPSGVHRALDVGCGAMGWLRVLAQRIERTGTIVGTDLDDKMLEAAATFVQEQRLERVVLEKDDLFSSGLAPASFDLTHARFQIAPLGRAEEQLTAYIRATKPGGLLVLEDPDTGSWHFNPRAAAAERLIELTPRGIQGSRRQFQRGSRASSATPLPWARAGVAGRSLRVAARPSLPAATDSIRPVTGATAAQDRQR